MGSHYLNQDLSKFLKEWLLAQDSKVDLLAHLGTLGRYAKEHLNLELTDPLNQFEYPELVRFFKLKELERGAFSVERIGKEKAALFEWLKVNHFDSYSEQFERVLSAKRYPLSADSDPRTFLEHFYEAAHPKGFDFKDYPHLSSEFAKTILSSELDSTRFFKEAERLTEKLLSVLTQTEAEKKLLDLTQDYLLLRKLFALELTREEFDEIKAREAYLLPSSIRNKINFPPSLIPSPPRRGRGEGEGALSLDPLFHRSLSFYRTARERERAIFENLFKALKQTKTENAVLITGGFHEEGLASLIKEKGFSYVSVSPRIQELEDNKTYLDAVLLRGTSLPRESAMPQPQTHFAPILEIRRQISPPDAEAMGGVLLDGFKQIGVRPDGPAARLHGLDRVEEQEAEEIKGVPSTFRRPASTVSSPRSELRQDEQSAKGIGQRAENDARAELRERGNSRSNKAQLAGE